MPNYKVRIVFRLPIYATHNVRRSFATTMGFLSVRSFAFALSIRSGHDYSKFRNQRLIMNNDRATRSGRLSVRLTLDSPRGIFIAENSRDLTTYGLDDDGANSRKAE